MIDAVLRQRKPLDTVLADHRPMAALGERERAFARNLIATTLQFNEFWLRAAVSDPQSELDPN